MGEGVLELVEGEVIFVAMGEDEAGPVFGVHPALVHLHQGVGREVELENPVHDGGASAPDVLSSVVARVAADAAVPMKGGMPSAAPVRAV